VTLEVYNFPLKEQTELENMKLEVVKSQRRVEMAELAVTLSLTSHVVGCQRMCCGVDAGLVIMVSSAPGCSTPD